MVITETEFLVQRARKRDPAAFSELIQTYTGDMYRVAFAILMNNEDASDAMQDAILACWEKIEKLKDRNYFKTWLIRILINKCYDIRRQKKRESTLEDIKEQPVEDVYNVEFEEALRFLDEKYRIIILLYYSEGYSTEEIAGLLKMSKNTVSTRLRRGREKLKNYYV